MADTAAPDVRLLEAARAGDADALERLLAPHTEPVYRFCLGVLRCPEDAEDAAQECLVRAIRALHRFRGEAALRTWLIRIALNVCRDWRRTADRTVPLDEETACHDAEDPEAAVIARLQASGALASLRPEYRAVLVLKEAEGLSVEEIGVAMGWSRKKAEHQLYFARRALAEWRARTEEGSDAAR